MNSAQHFRDEAIAQMQGTMLLSIAFIGISNGLFSSLSEMAQATSDELSAKTGLDIGYLQRWCDAAFSFGLLDEANGKFALTDRGRSFIPDSSGTAMPFAVQAMLVAHMAERAASLMKTGERPGEKVLAERETFLSLFGPMLEAMFSALFEKQILPNVPVYKEIDLKSGLAVDLGCGNGWYLRRLAQRFAHLRCIGLDGFKENISLAAKLAQRDGLAERLTFMAGDIYNFSVSEPVDLIAMNRALHHVWEDKEKVFGIFKNHLNNGGAVVIWEPNWPKKRSDLRDPSRRGMAFQNLAEHIQGNHFLQPEDIAAEFHNIGMKTDIHLFANGNEAVIVGRKANK